MYRRLGAIFRENFNVTTAIVHVYWRQEATPIASFRYCFKQISLPAAKKYASEVCECSPTYAMLMSLFVLLLYFCKVEYTDLLIIGRQLVELLCFSGDLPLHDICLQFYLKIWQINWLMMMLTYSIIAVTELQRRKSTTLLSSLYQYLLLNLNIK